MGITKIQIIKPKKKYETNKTKLLENFLPEFLPKHKYKRYGSVKKSGNITHILNKIFEHSLIVFSGQDVLNVLLKLEYSVKATYYNKKLDCVYIDDILTLSIKNLKLTYYNSNFEYTTEKANTIHNLQEKIKDFITINKNLIITIQQEYSQERDTILQTVSQDFCKKRIKSEYNLYKLYIENKKDNNKKSNLDFKEFVEIFELYKKYIENNIEQQNSLETFINFIDNHNSKL